MRKSIWKSKSFLTGLVGLAVTVVAGYGIDIPADVLVKVLEGILGLGGIVLVGKSASKRMTKE